MIEELIRVRGIGPTAAERLINAGIKSIEEIANSKAEELAWIKGIEMLSAKKIIENALELIAKKYHKLKKGGRLDLDATARMVLRDWQKGKIKTHH